MPGQSKSVVSLRLNDLLLASNPSEMGRKWTLNASCANVTKA